MSKAHQSATVRRPARRTSKLVVGIGAAAILSVAGMAGSAMAQQEDGEVSDFLECFGWMLTSPATHADNCLPSRIKPGLDTMAPSGSSFVLPPEEEPTTSGGSGGS